MLAKIQRKMKAALLMPQAFRKLEGDKTKAMRDLRLYPSNRTMPAPLNRPSVEDRNVPKGICENKTKQKNQAPSCLDKDPLKEENESSSYCLSTGSNVCKKTLSHSWDQSFPGHPHLLGKTGILCGAIYGHFNSSSTHLKA